MSNDFMSAMKKTLNDEYNVAFTENGADIAPPARAYLT